MSLRLLVAGCVVAASAIAIPVAVADNVASVTIDVSAAPASAEMDARFFKSEGITFAERYFVAYIQGDDALAPAGESMIVAARFDRPVSGVSVTVSQAFQGTSQYTLVAYSGSGEMLGTASLTVSQPPGEGYSTLAVSDLPSTAKRFSIHGTIGYGVSTVSYTYH